MANDSERQVPTGGQGFGSPDPKIVEMLVGWALDHPALLVAARDTCADQHQRPRLELERSSPQAR